MENSIHYMISEYHQLLDSLQNSESYSRIPTILAIAKLYPIIEMYAKQEAYTLLHQHKKILAAKEYRRILRTSLKEAKEIIDDMETVLDSYADEERRVAEHGLTGE